MFLLLFWLPAAFLFSKGKLLKIFIPNNKFLFDKWLSLLEEGMESRNSDSECWMTLLNYMQLVLWLKQQHNHLLCHCQ